MHTWQGGEPGWLGCLCIRRQWAGWAALVVVSLQICSPLGMWPKAAQQLDSPLLNLSLVIAVSFSVLRDGLES